MAAFVPECRPTLIGSMPGKNHLEAHQLVMAHTPEIPPWIQLPVFRQEGMVPQFLSGLPGLVSVDARQYVDTGSRDFEAALVS
ncbi:MAG: hypothetical protein GY697_14925, partial [Desulfobacterales bacterium]|nr:hypothetical protein [Desulfobacterales bacterium]